MTDGLMGEHAEDGVHMQVMQLSSAVGCKLGLNWSLLDEETHQRFTYFTLLTVHPLCVAAEPVLLQPELHPLQLLPDHQLGSLQCQR